MTQTIHEPASGRQHTYLSGEERRELERLRREHGTSASYVLRMGLRRLAGLPVPREFRGGDETGR